VAKPLLKIEGELKMKSIIAFSKAQKTEAEKSFISSCLVLIGLIWFLGFILLWITVGTVEILGGETFSAPLFWTIAVVAYTVFSYRFWDPVGIDEQAALTFFDHPISNVKSGAPYAPLFFIQVKKVTAKVIQREFPADPEHIYRGDMKSGEKLPDGMKPPIRVQFRNSITKEEAVKLFSESELNPVDAEGHVVPFVVDVPDDGLGRRVTAEPYPVVRFLITDPSEFLRNIGSITDALQQIEDEMFSVLTRFYPKMSVGQALQNIKWMNVHLFRSVMERINSRSGGSIKPWGIELQAAYVKYIYTSHGVNTAISEAAQAPFEKEKMIVTAQGEKERLTLEGQGKASAAFDLEKMTLDGRAAGLAKLAKELDISGREAQAAEVGRAVAEGGNTIIVGPEGMGQIAAIAAAFNKGGDKQKEGGK
jgi:hypothetical protein